MFSKLATVLSIVALVSAQNVFNTNTNKCNVGELNCCQSVNTADTHDTQTLAGILGLAVGSVPIGAGVTCNPISVLGVGTSSNCNAQPACCKKNNVNGLVTVACSPINVSV